jgi:aminopeptidase N
MINNNHQPVYLHDYQQPDYLIENVDLEFYLNETDTLVKSSLNIRKNPGSAHANKDLVLAGEELELQSIKLDNELLAASRFNKTATSLTIFAVPENFNLTIETRIQPEANTSLSGLYKSNGNFCTQCEAQGFRRITYFLDRPDVMARYTTKIIADEKRYPVLLSNGNPIAVGKAEGGKHWVKWEDPFKKPSYLFALVAGNLECVHDFFMTQSGRRVALRIYVEKGNQDKCAHAMQAVKKAMRWDEEKYGREYDLDIYMIVAVSDFNMGAMENKGLNIFNTKYILARPETATDLDFIHVESVIAHEYFHNWTGNRITCRDWFQLSLKEGLTIFRDQGFTADTTSKTVTRIQDVNALRTQQFPEDAGPLAHSVRPESYIEINNFYTETVYNKGSEVIGMIKTIIGDDLFRQGMDLYFARYDGEAVTIEAFVKVHEEASGVDLSQFRLWYSQAGTPVLHVTDNYDPEAKIYTLTIKQFCPPTPDQPEKKPLHIPLSMGLLDPSGAEIQSALLHVTHSENQFVFNDIVAKPIPSLLRNFSAPVKVQYNYSDHDLILLFKYDTDLFNRWEAGQKYAVNTILQLVHDQQKGKLLNLSDEFVAAFSYALKNMQHDQWLLSEMLTLPSEKYLVEQMAIIDVDAIHVAREFVLHQLAIKLKDQFKAIYTALNTQKPYEFTIQDVGARYLKNLCLEYLMMLPDAAFHEEIGMRQFNQALSSNMTDTMAALKALINTEGSHRNKALSDFYHKWHHDALVVDKWLALQATAKIAGTLQHVKKLVHHEAFDIKNPNKVYALIGAFGHNLIHFHAKNGEGYQFLAEVVLQLNALNPQVAARMIKPLTDWKRYDPERQVLMRKQLELLAKNSQLSPDVFEIVTKSL